MNTAIVVVWVLMSYTHSSNWIPTLEFKNQEKCEAAATLIREQTAQRLSWATIGNAPKGWCVKIEK